MYKHLRCFETTEHEIINLSLHTNSVIHAAILVNLYRTFSSTIFILTINW